MCQSGYCDHFHLWSAGWQRWPPQRKHRNTGVREGEGVGREGEKKKGERCQSAVVMPELILFSRPFSGSHRSEFRPLCRRGKGEFNVDERDMDRWMPHLSPPGTNASSGWMGTGGGRGGGW